VELKDLRKIMELPIESDFLKEIKKRKEKK